MAYPDYGAFMPTEALFTEPGSYSGVLKGEALKRASYLSEMDKFHEQLKVSSEQFEKQYSLAEKEFDFAEEQSLWEREFSQEQSKTQAALTREGFDHELTMSKIGSSAQSESARLQYNLGMEELGFRQDVESKKLSPEREWEIASSYLPSMSSSAAEKPLTKEQRDAPIVDSPSTSQVQTIATPKLDKFGSIIY